jgi:hypothetical protein
MTILSTMYGFKSWPTVDSGDFKKKSQLLQLVDFFVDFAVDFSSDFSAWENGRIVRTKWPQNLQKFPSKSTVDYMADPRSCNSLLFSRKLTNCRLKKKKPTTVDSSKKIQQQSIVIYRQNKVDFKAWCPPPLHHSCACPGGFGCCTFCATNVFECCIYLRPSKEANEVNRESTSSWQLVAYAKQCAYPLKLD